MGDYAIFIWPCFIVTIAAMVILGFTSWKSKENNKKYVKTLEDYIDQLSQE